MTSSDPSLLATDLSTRRKNALPLARIAGLMGVLGLSLIVAVSVWLAWRDYQRAFEQARREVGTAAFSLSDHAGRLVESANVVLKSTLGLVGGSSWDAVARDEELQRQIKGFATASSYIDNVWLNDETGVLRVTSFAFPAPASNASDREAFKALRAPTDRLSIGERIVGKVTGKPTFLIARRIEDADGGFRGMASVTADLSYFNEYWSRVQLPVDTRVRLVRAGELDVLAQHPAPKSGEPFIPFDRSLVRSAIERSPISGEVDLPANEADAPRIMAYRQVGTLPLYITVGVSTDAVAELWRQSLRSFVPVEGGAFLVLLALTLLAFRQAKREKEDAERIEAAREALASANLRLEERVAERTAELSEETERLDTLNQVGMALASELDAARLSETVIQAATRLVGAAYGALFERVPAGREGNAEDLWRLAALAGAPTESFTRFGLPRATNLFGPTFRAEGPVRSDDVSTDPRYGSLGGMPEGHLPVRSYLAVPVVSRSSEVLGALLFGHPRPARFSEREERLIMGFAGQTAVALDNARLFSAVQRENEDRRRAEEELKESNEEIQRYAYIVSHDLRAPLVNVMGFTSELEAIKPEIIAAGAKPADDPVRKQAEEDFDEALSFIKAAISKMDRLINAILKLSREGRRNFRAEPLDMSAVLTDLAAAQRHQAAAKGAEVHIAADLPHLVADRLAVEQIFANLLDNALKYLSPKRAGQIEISGERAGPTRVRFKVRDNGRGVAPEDHGRIFELFRRSGVQDVAGEGIGLAHVKALVRSMGGTIAVSSELDKGTVFTVVLPAMPMRGTGVEAAG
ncbi:ATP-binding protein [Mesorhizobium sp. RP14(2022)]|uniref:histidine kinase n=1 Tax=Mesorhizobium liriopis TaxID=2953882 RepID=A0ABT1C901_9HYPH|nr:ATP-binding protein [Mesorhizobium liriopis]MCO6051262.1 ATP-binding protein [Mesorhizobium liriopis]